MRGENPAIMPWSSTTEAISPVDEAMELRRDGANDVTDLRRRSIIVRAYCLNHARSINKKSKNVTIFKVVIQYHIISYYVEITRLYRVHQISYDISIWRNAKEMDEKFTAVFFPLPTPWAVRCGERRRRSGLGGR